MSEFSVLVEGIDSRVDRQDLQYVFRHCGPIQHISLASTSATLRFASASACKEALREHGRRIHDCTLRVRMLEEPPRRSSGSSSTSSRTSSRCVVVSNYDGPDRELYSLLVNAGKIAELKYDSGLRIHRIWFDSSKYAEEAVRKYDGKSWKGKPIQVQLESNFQRPSSSQRDRSRERGDHPREPDFNRNHKRESSHHDSHHAHGSRLDNLQHTNTCIEITTDWRFSYNSMKDLCKRAGFVTKLVYEKSVAHVEFDSESAANKAVSFLSSHVEQGCSFSVKKCSDSKSQRHRGSTEGPSSRNESRRGSVEKGSLPEDPDIVALQEKISKPYLERFNQVTGASKIERLDDKVRSITKKIEELEQSRQSTLKNYIEVMTKLDLALFDEQLIEDEVAYLDRRIDKLHQQLAFRSV